MYICFCFFFFKQKTAYEMRISDWSSDVCSSDLKVKRILTRWQQELPWNAVFFENHDGMRSVSRFGDDKRYHHQSATMLATLLSTLRGTPFIYQGQEIGRASCRERVCQYG